MAQSKRDHIFTIISSSSGVTASEISEKVGISRQATHRHLRQLETQRMIRKEGSGAHVRYHAVADVPLTKEGVIREIGRIFHSQSDVLLVTLFGSLARGTDTHRSDVDVMVWLHPETSLTRRDIWSFWDQHAKHLSWADRVSLIVTKLRPRLSIHTLLLDLPEEHDVILDRDKYFPALKEAVVSWRRRNGSYKIPSFEGKHSWAYSDKECRLSDIDFTIEVANVPKKPA